MANEKKYFTIAEVSALTNLAAYKIRYLERTSKFLPIVQVRGRRYYTKESIEYLKQNYSIIKNISDKFPNNLNDSSPSIHKVDSNRHLGRDDKTENQQMLLRIDRLMDKLYSLLAYGSDKGRLYSQS